ncbi:hypothetical protein G4B88_018337 [Cannabis sativa]|uniref:Uncharacterized protein n=1 Tax=Cannabis sativa TaxID=3483 RepID=A0A7J6EYH8_CANSA|nr:hypothetical protein G4B88_018337 [Cannabis sativa]
MGYFTKLTIYSTTEYECEPKSLIVVVLIPLNHFLCVSFSLSMASCNGIVCRMVSLPRSILGIFKSHGRRMKKISNSTT